MTAVERAATVARLEQHLEGGKNWDLLFARCVTGIDDPDLRAALLTDKDLYAELELLVFDEIAEELAVG